MRFTTEKIEQFFDELERARGLEDETFGVYGITPQLTLPIVGAPSFYHRNIVTTMCPSGAERMEHLLSLLEHGNVDLSPLFTHRMKLADAPKAIDLFRSKAEGVLKIAITP